MRGCGAFVPSLHWKFRWLLFALLLLAAAAGALQVPVFWACGVTPQMAIENAKPPLAITHSPGHMFVTDVLNEDLVE